MSFDSFVATVLVDGRRLHFAAIVPQARLRVTLADPWEESEVLGSVIRLDTGEPGLRVAAPLQVEWANLHADRIITEATRVWASVTRHCSG
ncbi:hypothetical protein [Glycomyces paridis]|uniref:Uncharacterized protein n=1 Tax=Glycomyces paridis TaxID=2126555 RepID=A0A4S8P2X8_9ACTN|nr:hypothetical protein [Glycomyces paridis]THV22044.1 hypothetical protein E9998_23780 [Glycomyces paridis]